MGKIAKIVKVFDDAYRSQEAIIVIDNIERLIEYVSYGPRFSNHVLQALMILIKKIPEREDGKLLIIGTTSKNYVLKDLEIVTLFDIVLKVQLLGVEEIKQVLMFYKCENVLAQEIAEFIKKIAIK